MTDKQLRKLGRRDLLEILLLQSKELERVKKELQEAREELEQRQLAISNAGSIAEAALKLSGIFEAAQAAADQYLENMSIPPEQRTPAAPVCGTAGESLLEETREQCRQMLAQTRMECDRMLAQAEQTSRHMQYDALRRELNLTFEEKDYES